MRLRNNVLTNPLQPKISQMMRFHCEHLLCSLARMKLFHTWEKKSADRSFDYTLNTRACVCVRVYVSENSIMPQTHCGTNAIEHLRNEMY